MTGNISFKEFKEIELLLLREDQLIFKDRKYEFIDLFNSLNLIEDSNGLLKETRNSSKIRPLDFEKKNDSSTPKNVL